MHPRTKQNTKKTAVWLNGIMCNKYPAQGLFLSGHSKKKKMQSGGRDRCINTQQHYEKDPTKGCCEKTGEGKAGTGWCHACVVAQELLQEVHARAGLKAWAVVTSWYRGGEKERVKGTDGRAGSRWNTRKHITFVGKSTICVTVGAGARPGLA